MEFHGEEVTIGCGAGLSTMIREAAALGLGGIECLVGIPATLGRPRHERRHRRRRHLGLRVGRVLRPPGRDHRAQTRPGCPCTAPSRSRPGPSSWGCGCSSTGSRRRRSWPRSGRDSGRRRPRSRSRSRRWVLSGRTPTTTRPRSCSRDRARGKRVGGAGISAKHASFIINRGGATAQDVIGLLELAFERVHSQTGSGSRRSSESWAMEPSTDRPTRYGQHLPEACRVPAPGRCRRRTWHPARG